MRDTNLNAIAKLNHLDAIIAQHEILKEFHDTKVKPLESKDDHRGESALLTQSDTITNFAVTLQWKTQSENQLTSWIYSMETIVTYRSSINNICVHGM